MLFPKQTISRADMCHYIYSRISYRILRLRGDTFLGIVNVCTGMRNRYCANHALLGGSGDMPPPRNFFEKIAALRLNLVGFGS